MIEFIVEDIVKIFERYAVRYSITGGLAIQQYILDRETDDLDFSVIMEYIEDIEDFSEKLIPELRKNHEVSYRFTADILMVNVDGIQVDFIRTYYDVEEQLVKNAENGSLFGVTCKIPTIEDLLLMKLNISQFEERHFNDVVNILNTYRETLAMDYIHSSIIRFNMKNQASYFNELAIT